MNKYKCDLCGSPMKERVIGVSLVSNLGETSDDLHKEHFYRREAYDRLLICTKCPYGKKTIRNQE